MLRGAWHYDSHLVKGTDVQATPDALDRVAFERHWFGGAKPSVPDAVVILVPGFFGAASNFRYVGERLVTRAPNLQVWAMERRNNLLENRCGMEKGEEEQSVGGLTLVGLYYLSGLDVFSDCPSPDDPEPTVWNGIDNEHFLSQQEAGSLGMAEWGLETELKDIRKLVRLAHRRYPDAKVVLGGHSLGGMTTQAYAGWRFGKKASSAGWRELDGIVMIDGSNNGLRWEERFLPQHFEREQELTEGINYWQEAAAGYLLGYLAEIGGMASSFAPEEESFLWASLEGTPLQWPDPETCPTNKGIFAALTDDSFAFSGTFEMHQGSLAAPVDLDGDGSDDHCAGANADRLLAHWTDFDETEPAELVSTDRWSRLNWEGTDANFAEWFFSIALNSEMDLANNLDSRVVYTDPMLGETTAADAHKQRVFDTAKVAIPAYGFVAAFCLEPYEWYGTVATSLPDYTLVDRSGPGCDQPASEPWSHLDPLLAQDTGGFTNDFVTTLLKWLNGRVLR